MEYVAFIAVVILVGLFIIPNKKKATGSHDHEARVPGCTCKDVSRWSITIDYNCPVHGDWQEPLYPIEEIKLAGKSERERANIKAGIAYNKILKDKWSK